MNGIDNTCLVNKMPLNQDIFFSNGFDDASYQKIKKTLLKKSNTPFQKTDINKRLEEFFIFFSSLDVNLDDVRKGITLSPEFLTHTPTKINQNNLDFQVSLLVNLIVFVKFLLPYGLSGHL